MRTADRLRAKQWAFPLGITENLAYMQGVAEALEDDEHRPVIVADNVARYVHDRNPAICLEAYPSLAPPWPEFWIEYPSSSGRQRRGVYVHDITETAKATPFENLVPDDETHLPQLGAAAITDALGNGSMIDDIAWVVSLSLMVEQDRHVWGPAGLLCLALDHGGQVIGNRWSIAPVMFLKDRVDELVEEAKDRSFLSDDFDEPLPSLEELKATAEKLDTEGRRALLHQLEARRDRLERDAEILRARADRLGEGAKAGQFLAALASEEDDRTTWLMRALAAAFQTVAFLHCKNVALDPVIPPAKVQARRRKDRKRPLVRYHTLRIDVPRPSSGGDSAGGRDLRAWHTVAGHFAHYGDCCPNHPPRGRLFGRLTGVYWMPTHARGSRSTGEVRTDFEVRDVEDVPSS